MKKRAVIIFLLLTMVTLGSFYFIQTNNDHLECSETTTQEKSAEGEMVLVKQHNCKERFPF